MNNSISVSDRNIYKDSMLSLAENPLKDLIDDKVFRVLQRHNLLDEKAIRDYQIRKMFKEMRQTMNAGDAIDHLRDMYPYLQFDTIRKIVYQISK
jgi:hypothetical protein